ncbi:MAG TPA: HAMP domain-containing protein [Chloroflexota bacterium]|nr:HAMP domain-containing protein [Chloroflexota bacterium]
MRTTGPPSKVLPPKRFSLLPRGPVHMGLWWRLLMDSLIVGLVPLLLLTLSAFRGYNEASYNATRTAAQVLDELSLRTLTTRAEQTAREVSRFLDHRVHDTRAATLLPRTPEAYLSFYEPRRGEIWSLSGTAQAPQERRERLPLYREMAYIDANGQERLRIVDGRVVPGDALRNVADPAQTTYPGETYFAEARALAAGEVYTSPVTGWYVPRETRTRGGGGGGGGAGLGGGGTPELVQLSSRLAQHEAVVRFATPVFTASGAFDGIVVLSLDHRHVMEHALHLVPGSKDPWVAFPDFTTANFSYIVDDQGWTIADPRHWRMRGIDPNTGQVPPPQRRDMTPDERSRHPFNLQFGAWADPSYPGILEAMRRGESGFTFNTDEDGGEMATIFAPITVSTGPDGVSRFFGGLCINAAVAEFHTAADTVSQGVELERTRLLKEGAIITVLAVGLVFLSAALVARGITLPVRRLTQAARAMEQGEIDSATLDGLQQRRIVDEVTTLAHVFRRMAEQVQLRERRLKERIVQLHIRIDEQQKQQQVAEITETEYFQSLQASARAMRDRHRRSGVEGVVVK